MHFKTTPRKIKAKVKLIMLSIGLFCLTLAVCVGFFSMTHFAKTIVSPLSRIFHPSGNTIVLVKSLCEKDHLPCQTIESLSDNVIQITLDNNAIVLLSTTKDIQSQLTSLQQALSQLTIKGKQFTKLDFRFDTAVVTF